MERKGAQLIESVHRALVLLKLINQSGSISVTEAAAALGVNASTSHRLLMTLVADGFVVRRSDRRYATGPELAAPVAPGDIVTGHLRPALEELAQRTGETVHVGTLIGTRMQYLDGIETRQHPLRFSLRIGEWVPANRSAGGKALLADLTDDEIDARFAMALSGPHRALGTVDMESLHEQIEEIRTTRIGWNFGDTEPGVAAMAISVGTAGAPRAALAVAVPMARFTKEKGEQWSEYLIEIADAVDTATERGEGA